MTRHIAYPAYLTGLSIVRGAGARPMRQLRRFQELARSEPAVWQAYRNGLLSELLTHALREIPFYRGLPGELYALALEAPLQALQGFPVLTKADVQSHEKELLARDHSPLQLRSDYTGGSTGSPTRFWHDRRRIAVRLLGTYRDMAYSGWRLGDRMAFIEAPRGMYWMRSAFLRAANRWTGACVGLNVFHMDPHSNREFLAAMEVTRPAVLWVIASGAHEFAAFAESEGISPRLHALDLKAIILTCDRLLPFQRERVERVFNAPVFDLYGSHDTGIIATECAGHHGRHVPADNVFVEILDDEGRPVPPGMPGRIVVTDLWNRGFAVIRYDVADVGHFLREDIPCPCGVTFPRIAPPDGRVSDFLTLRDGTRLHGDVFSHLLYGLPGLRRFQVIQEVPSEAVLLCQGNPKAIEPALRQRLKKLPAGLDVRVEFCDEIPRTGAGKRQYVISHVSPPTYLGPPSQQPTL